MRVTDALISLQERLPRFGGAGPPRPSRTVLVVATAAFGLATSYSAFYIARHLGSPEALDHYPGLPMFLLSLSWVVLNASELLRQGGTGEVSPSRRRVASAALTLAAWLVLFPAVLAYGMAISYAASGLGGVLAWAAFFVLLVALAFVVGRYSGPVRRGPGR